jgi:outer membrane lipoprotein-sorting protein
MTDTRLWDRAALATIPADGRRAPAVAALPAAVPTVQDLFDYMRDAELRFSTLMLRILERSGTTRGDDETQIDVVMRHPGHAKVTTSRPGEYLGGQYELWVSDGDLVRTYAARHKLGTQRPIRNRPRGLADPDLPGMSRVYEPVTALPAETLPETFIHPAGYCQNVLATGRCTVTGSALVRGREAILLQCDHPRAIEMSGDRPDHRIDLTVDRQLGVILRLVESFGPLVTRDAEVTDIRPEAPLPPTAFDFVFPTGTTMLY